MITFSGRLDVETYAKAVRKMSVMWTYLGIPVILIAVVLVVGLAAFAVWYFRVCGNCGPIICDDPCSLPTFGQAWELPGTDA